ncbi:hypothetical protein [Streptomyces sp. NPDC052015]
MSAQHLLAEGPVPWARGGAAAVVLFALGLAGTRRPRRLVTVGRILQRRRGPPTGPR